MFYRSPNALALQFDYHPAHNSRIARCAFMKFHRSAFLCIALLFALASFGCAQLDGYSKEGVRAGRGSKGAAPVVYVALGDSTGVGYGAREGGYVQRLLARIQQQHPEARGVNLSKSGASSADALRDQVKRCSELHPTLVTVGLGANDILRGVRVEQFADNYERIVVRLKEMGAHIVAMNLPDMSLAPTIVGATRDDTRRRILLFNKSIEEIAGRHGVPLVDLFGATRELIPAHPEFFSSDGFHPSDKGYEFWTEAMWSTVETAINHYPA
jgi:lysophospholipase L1-like esterase